MPFTLSCDDCRNIIPPSASKCPHCGRPGIFPNVKIALHEQGDLEIRYQVAIEDAKLRELIATVEDFEQATKKSVAVINRWLPELERLIPIQNRNGV